MITLNLIGDKGANLLRQPDNHEIKERVKDSFKNLMATYIRQSVEKNGIDELLILPFEVKLINRLYPEHRFIKEGVGIELKRSEFKIPTPVRIQNSSPYIYVGDGINTYTYTTAQELIRRSSFLSMGSAVYYFVENEYIYCKTNDDTHKIKSDAIIVKSIYENPEQVLGYYNTSNDLQDIVIPFPRDMIAKIFIDMLRGEFGIIAVPEEIKVELNERPE